jgi:hypothetical protein
MISFVFLTSSCNIDYSEIGGGLVVNGKIEVYSTKKAGDDKKTSKIIESKLSDNISSSSTKTGPDLNTKGVQKLLVELIQTLNASYIDHDFSELQAASFSVLPVNDAIQNINAQLGDVSWQSPSYLNRLWREIDECIGTLSGCEVYKLSDDVIMDIDDGIVWCLNYFFCNKELKRVCYFTCTAANKYRKNRAGELLDEEYGGLGSSQEETDGNAGSATEHDESEGESYSVV